MLKTPLAQSHQKQGNVNVITMIVNYDYHKVCSWSARTLMQNKHFIFKIMLEYETNKLRTESTVSSAKSTDIGGKQKAIDANQLSCN